MTRKIKDLSDIEYKTNPEGRLLFTALTILTTENYKDKTPDEVINILNDKSTFIDEIESKDFSERIQYEMQKLNKEQCPT